MSVMTKQRCFTFIWTVENISYCWQQFSESIESPAFVINEIQDERFKLKLFPRGNGFISNMTLYLIKTNPGERIDCELSLLSKKGSVLMSRTRESSELSSLYLFQNIDYIFDEKFIFRCRIWKKEGEMGKNVQCFARTRICIEKNSFLWEVKDFSRFQPEEKRTYQIKSILDNELLMTLDLLPKNRYTDEDCLTLQLVSENPKIKRFIICVSLLNEGGSANEMIQKEFMFLGNSGPKLLTLPFSKNDLIENKKMLLPNDVLTLRCDCTFANGIILNEIDTINYDCDRIQASELDNHCLDERNTFSLSKLVFNENIKSLLRDNILSDIKLKTKTKTFLAHKSILSARSPVFKAMFENDMKEKNNASVDIEDLDSDTVDRMLRYVYTAEVQDLQIKNACELYRAADKYEILALRDECSTFLKSNLSAKNACEMLILADMHQDDELKAFTQDFIFNHDVINSEEWKLLMETHLKLAADTMFFKIQRKTNKSPSGTLSSFSSGLAKTSFALTDKSLTGASDLNSGISFSSGFKRNVEIKTKRNSDRKKSFRTSFSFSSKSTPVEPSSLFSSKTTPAEPSVPFSSKSNTSVEPSSLFSSKSISAEPFFTFGSKSTPVESSFTFGSNSMLAQPSFSFGSLNKYTVVTFPPFPFGHKGDASSSLSSEVTSSKKETASIIPETDKSSAENPCLSIESESNKLHSACPSLGNSKEMLYVVPKSPFVSTLTTSELDSTSTKTSDTSETNSNINESPSETLALNNSMKMITLNGSSEINCSKEPTHLDILTPKSSSVETHSSNPASTPKTESNSSVYNISEENASTSSKTD